MTLELNQKEYIADYGNWHFESFWNEMTESWCVYQAKKTAEGYKMVRHCLRDEPIKTAKDAKEMVENWREFIRRIIEEVTMNARNDNA